MIENLSARLRDLRDQNGWTVADMAERTGIPKRTLDKYMLRTDASLPGFDALCALSKGLGVSLDWLVFGAEGSSKSVELISEQAAYKTVLMFAEVILREFHAKNEKFVVGERILNMTPEGWADYFSSLAGEEAHKLVLDGVSLSGLLDWERRKRERGSELFRDMVEDLYPGEKTPWSRPPAPVGNGN